MLQVHAGWVLDTDVFNEWMNEEDYCVNERNIPVNLRPRANLREEQVRLGAAFGSLRYVAFWFHFCFRQLQDTKSTPIKKRRRSPSPSTESRKKGKKGYVTTLKKTGS